ncbi:beta-ketoacyl-[acyl-carrier-protein] synthase family protein [Ferrimicrobium acidiphilum]|uniref:beta-ketoacyl-[acyl-carrier-protein] synthase family protein n=1 Tax=Ferrimicrobium acidiphilum TaxID=121039 RepID=UPI0023F51AFF|nr:beta-ketoacyl-ACP synthase II [Ferrimicrobium acidiphilum]
MRLSYGDNPIFATHRVAVTGLGVVSGLGLNLESFWQGLLTPPPPGIRRAEGFDPTQWLNAKEIRRHDRYNQMGVAAADMALADAGNPSYPADRVAVWMGTGVGGLESLENQVVIGHERGYSRVSPFLVPLMMANSNAASISMRFGFQGPCETSVTACAASNHAIANAAHLVATGRVDMAVTGGAEAAITKTASAGFVNMTATSKVDISRPFDRNRDGFVMGEGAGVVVLEDYDKAVARGARIYATIDGIASTADAFHITQPAPGGVGAHRAMLMAIEDAGITVNEIAHINAHGTSTPMNDLAEATAIRSLFGDLNPPVTSVKGALGHALGAAGGLEAVAVGLTFAHQLIPPTANTIDLDPEVDIDVVLKDPRPLPTGHILSNSFGFGGHNACIVFGPPPS